MGRIVDRMGWGELVGYASSAEREGAGRCASLYWRLVELCTLSISAPQTVCAYHRLLKGILVVFSQTRPGRTLRSSFQPCATVG